MTTVKTEKLQTIKVALVLPLTGGNGKTGRDLLRAALTSEKLLNNFEYDKSFAGRYRFEIVPFDDACEVKKATRIAEKIVAAGDIRFVIGHFCSEATERALKIYQNKGILQFTPFSTAPELTEKGVNTFFRLAGRTDDEAETAALWLASFGRNREIALIYEDNLYAKGLAAHIYVNLKKNGVELKTVINASAYQNASEKILAEITAKNAEVIFYAGYLTGMADLVNKAAKANKKLIFFGSGAAHARSFWERTGRNGEGVLFVFTEDVTRDLPERELNQLKMSMVNRFDGRQFADRGTEKLARTSIRTKNKILKTRSRFMISFFNEYNRFPGIFAAHQHATLEIIRLIASSDDFGLHDARYKNEDGQKTDDPKYFSKTDWADKTAYALKNKGRNQYTDYIGFETILGAVNFNLNGDWSNAEYIVYKWTDKVEKRAWLEVQTDRRTEKYIGRSGDYVKVF